MSDKVKDIEKDLEALAMEQEPDLDGAIEKVIRKKMRRVALKTTIAVLVAVAVIFLGVSPIVDHCYPDPTKLNGKPSQLLSVLRTYYETMYPHREVLGVDVERDGFGCYTLYLNMADHREKIVVGVSDVTMKMKLGKLSVADDSEGLTVFTSGIFAQEDEDLESVEEGWMEDMLSEIRKLPETSRLYLNISDKQAKDIEKLVARQNDDFRLEWVQIYQPECDFQAGLQMQLSAAYDDSDKRSECSAEELKEIYIRNLKVLQDNFDLWKSLGLHSGNTYWEQPDISLLEQSISAAESSEDFRSKYYCVSGSRDEILKYLDSIDCTMFTVDKVRYSSFE